MLPLPREGGLSQVGIYSRRLGRMCGLPERVFDEAVWLPIEFKSLARIVWRFAAP